MLKKRVDRLFQSALARTDEQPGLLAFHRLLQQCCEQLDQPMRVAIVGLIKAGKSTLMNALLGEAVVATGTVETTFNVNWLKYGAPPSLLVHFKKDGSQPEPKSFEELEALTRRVEEEEILKFLLSIKYIEVSYPNEILKTFNLIDTPGLASSYKDDSQNTIDFVIKHGKELTEATEAQAANADAVLYLFSKGISTTDRDIVEQFQGPVVGQATPINAIGVLTKVDVSWRDAKVSHPIAEGNKIAQRLLSEHPEARRLFYTIYPVCGLLALGAQSLKADEFAILTELAKLPEERFERLIGNVTRFREREYPDVPVPPSQRRKVEEKLGQYGVVLAYKLIRKGVNNRENLADELLKQSGFPQLRDLILSHFGNRAYLIKLGTVLRQISAAYFQQRRDLQETPQLQILEEIAGDFDELQAQEHAFQELKVLRSHYERKLDFDGKEEKQLLQVTGEYGTSCGERLGLSKQAKVDEMMLVAEKRMHYWHQQANEFGKDLQTIDAARVLSLSYAHILDRIQEAQRCENEAQKCEQKAKEYRQKAKEYLYI